MINLIFASVLLALSLVDILLTNKVLSRGGRELNRLMRWCMNRFGKYWWAPKEAITVLGTIILLWYGQWMALTGAVIVQAGIVAWNIKEYRKQT